MAIARATRLTGLDTLRSLAIVSVMLFHFERLMPPAFASFSKFGWMGVDLFFVLSGYLIGSQLLRAKAGGGKIDFLRFYRARALRILPAYLVVLAVYFLVPVWRESDGISPLWEFLTFTENLFVDYAKNKAFSHVWSLCVEEHFYLVLPVLVLWLGRRPSLKKTVSMLVAVVLAGMAVRTFVLLHTLQRTGTDSDNFGVLYIEQIYYPTWARLDGLLAGVSLALLRTFRPSAWTTFVKRGDLLTLIGASIVGCCVWMFYHRFDSVAGVAAASTIAGFPLMSAGLALLVASALAPGSWIGRMRVPGAEVTARLAFGLYLSHKGVTTMFSVYLPRVAEARNWLTALLLFASWYLVAAMLYYAVERPFLQLRDRIEKRGSEGVDVEARVEPAL